MTERRRLETERWRLEVEVRDGEVELLTEEEVEEQPRPHSVSYSSCS